MHQRAVRTSFAVLLTLLAAACGSNKHNSSPPTPPTVTATTTTPSSTAPATSTVPHPDLAAVHLGLQPVATGLASPVAIAWRKGDTRLFVAEQQGRVRAVSAAGVLEPAPVLTLSPLSHGNEQGLLGITFSPDGTKLYTDSTDAQNNTHIDEFTMRANTADPASKRTLLVQQQPFSNHNGGEVVFGPDGMLYVGFGDGGSAGDPQRNGQNRNTLLAKIIRIDPKANGNAPYSVPSDNPWVGQGGRPETWMWGFRNPWRFSFDRATGDLWIGDVGQNLYEEIDRAPAGSKGVNFGWSVREGFHAFNAGAATGATDPVLETSHADGNCAIVGGYVYRGRAIPALVGVYLFGDNCTPAIVGVVHNGAKVTDQRATGLQVTALTSFGEGPDGELYVLARGGTISRLVSK